MATTAESMPVVSFCSASRTVAVIVSVSVSPALPVTSAVNAQV